MLARIQQYQKDGKTIQPDWHKYITDKKIPLDDRWGVFLAAPSEWKVDVSSSNVPLACLSKIFDSPYDDFDMERGSELDAEELFEQIEYAKDDGEIKGITDQIIVKTKEQAMKMRLGSWKYDW